MKLDIGASTIRIGEHTFSVVLEDSHSDLSRAWDRANQRVRGDETPGSRLSEDQRMNDAEQVINLDQRLRKIEERALLEWSRVADTKFRGLQGIVYTPVLSVKTHVLNRIFELAMIEGARPNLDEEEVKELSYLTEFLAFPLAIVQKRRNRQVGCDAAREYLPTPLVPAT